MNIIWALLSVLFGAYFLHLGIQGFRRGTITYRLHTYTGCLAKVVSGFCLLIGLGGLLIALNFLQS
ncbi:hypothetical protein [Roseiflexus castenholzii]|uniref:hypothetical protein n=1 Tax=Roseiflexus castenholzii TaxID=120962 RepID=UPI00031EFAE1|nr:hypothetical protein [Roseiflexus castenholzii]